MRPRARGTDKYACFSFLCTPSREQRRARGDSRPLARRRKAQRADAEGEARGRAKGWADGGVKYKARPKGRAVNIGLAKERITREHARG